MRIFIETVACFFTDSATAWSRSDPVRTLSGVVLSQFHPGENIKNLPDTRFRIPLFTSTYILICYKNSDECESGKILAFKTNT